MSETKRKRERLAYMWALTRDYELFAAYPTRKAAAAWLETYAPGSKHIWKIVKVQIKKAHP